MKDSYNIKAKGMGSGRGRVSGRAFRMYRLLESWQTGSCLLTPA